MERKTVKFSVTQEDIDSGYRCSYTNCPVALSVCRTTGCPTYVGEDDDMSGCYIWISLTSNPEAVWSTPLGVLEFIAAYDEFGPDGVHPFEFELVNVPIH